MAEMGKKQNALQAIKFALFSASAGIIQVASFTLLNEVVVPNINIQNEAVMKILSSEYGVCYLIALILSVIWNFTFNRKFTFKSATNIPVAMLKIFGFYCVFTPVSTIVGEMVMRNTTWEFAEYIVLAVTMMTNMITEFLFCRFVVYKDSMNTNDLAKKEKEKLNVTE
jgi:putative flippase GtrA